MNNGEFGRNQQNKSSITLRDTENHLTFGEGYIQFQTDAATDDQSSADMIGWMIYQVANKDAVQALQSQVDYVHRSSVCEFYTVTMVDVHEKCHYDIARLLFLITQEKNLKGLTINLTTKISLESMKSFRAEFSEDDTAEDMDDHMIEGINAKLRSIGFKNPRIQNNKSPYSLVRNNTDTLVLIDGTGNQVGPTPCNVEDDNDNSDDDNDYDDDDGYEDNEDNAVNDNSINANTPLPLYVLSLNIDSRDESVLLTRSASDGLISQVGTVQSILNSEISQKPFELVVNARFNLYLDFFRDIDDVTLKPIFFPLGLGKEGLKGFAERVSGLQKLPCQKITINFLGLGRGEVKDYYNDDVPNVVILCQHLAEFSPEKLKHLTFNFVSINHFFLSVVNSALKKIQLVPVTGSPDKYKLQKNGNDIFKSQPDSQEMKSLMAAEVVKMQNEFCELQKKNAITSSNNNSNNSSPIGRMPPAPPSSNANPNGPKCTSVPTKIYLTSSSFTGQKTPKEMSDWLATMTARTRGALSFRELSISYESRGETIALKAPSHESPFDPHSQEQAVINEIDECLFKQRCFVIKYGTGWKYHALSLDESVVLIQGDHHLVNQLYNFSINLTSGNLKGKLSTKSSFALQHMNARFGADTLTPSMATEENNVQSKIIKYLRYAFAEAGLNLESTGEAWKVSRNVENENKQVNTQVNKQAIKGSRPWPLPALSHWGTSAIAVMCSASILLLNAYHLDEESPFHHDEQAILMMASTGLMLAGVLGSLGARYAVHNGYFKKGSIACVTFALLMGMMAVGAFGLLGAACWAVGDVDYTETDKATKGVFTTLYTVMAVSSAVSGLKSVENAISFDRAGKPSAF